MRIPTKKQIKAEAVKLSKLKPDVRSVSGFGNNNHAAIDAQIRVLKENMGEDEIYDVWGGEVNSVRNNALEARFWMDGESEDGSPSYGWKAIARK